MLKFETLASSSAGCAYRLSGGGASRPLLLDCGLPYKQLQKALGFRVSELAGCLISHAHQDHCKAWKGLTGAAIVCFASAETWAAIAPTPPGYYCAEASDTEIENVGDWNVLPFYAEHDCPGTLGYLIGSPSGERCLYLTDSCYSRFRFEGLTMIAVECNHSVEIMRKNLASGMIDQARFERTLRTHMSIERLLDMLAATDKSRLSAIYLLHLSDANSDEAAFKEAIERATGIPTIVAQKRMAV